MSSNEERDSIENISSVSEAQELLDQYIQEYKRKNGSATNSPNKKRQTFDDTDATKRKFESLKNTVKKDEETIAALENENAILKAEIQRCEARIKAYPQTKKRYEQLSENLSKAHQIQMYAKKH